MIILATAAALVRYAPAVVITCVKAETDNGKGKTATEHPAPRPGIALSILWLDDDV
jgi:hypothetical protein